MKNKTKKIPKDWWKSAFGENYYAVYASQLPSTRTLWETNFIYKKTRLSPTKKILDLGCGHGRHSIALARFGCKVTGLDYSKLFLKMAEEKAKHSGLQINFIHGDMRKMQLVEEFDVVISMFSSFGYFSNQENIETLAKIYTAIKPGGYFLLDVINAHNLAQNAHTGGRHDGKGEYVTEMRYDLDDATNVSEVNTYSDESQIGHTHKYWQHNHKKGELHLYMIEYTVQQYQTMLENIGFRIENIYGDYNGCRWTQDTPRTILLCYKSTNGFMDWYARLRSFLFLKILRRWPILH